MPLERSIRKFRYKQAPFQDSDSINRILETRLNEPRPGLTPRRINNHLYTIAGHYVSPEGDLYFRVKWLSLPCYVWELYTKIRKQHTSIWSYLEEMFFTDEASFYKLVSDYPLVTEHLSV